MRLTSGTKVGKEAWDRRRSADFAVEAVSVDFMSPLVQRAWHAKAALFVLYFRISFYKPQYSIVERSYWDKDGVSHGLSYSHSSLSELWSATVFQHSGWWQVKGSGWGDEPSWSLCPSFIPVAVVKGPDGNKLRAERVYFKLIILGYSPFISGLSRWQKLEIVNCTHSQEQKEMNADRLTCLFVLSSIFLGDGVAHSGWCLPRSVNLIKTVPPQTYPLDNPDLVRPSLRSSF